MNYALRISWLLLLALWLPTAPAWSATGSVEMRLRALESRMPDADRLAALEKSYSSQGAGILAAELEQLKQEVRELRGLIEQLNHQLRQQQQGQQKLYGDLDRRLQALEAADNTATTPAGQLADLPAGGAAASIAGGSEASEQQEYLAAFNLLQQGKTSDAIPAFRSFLEKYPSGSYASNGLYWLGEAHFVNKDYAASLDAFSKLVAQHPQSSKTPGALLKIGYIHYETRNFLEARTVLENVKSSYPGNNVSALAAERLERMRKEGV